VKLGQGSEPELTSSLECVAKSTRRPLLRLTVADIGTSERVMEDILGEWFQRGTDWGAIILIDEADVFLEKRQVKDLQRNSLVSGGSFILRLETNVAYANLTSIFELHGVLHWNVVFGMERRVLLWCPC
jgi:hypothetical protein